MTYKVGKTQRHYVLLFSLAPLHYSDADGQVFLWSLRTRRCIRKMRYANYPFLLIGIVVYKAKRARCKGLHLHHILSRFIADVIEQP